MAWENQKPEDKNLESMRQELSLENIMNADVLSEPPDLDEMKEGWMRLAFDSGNLYLYTRCGNKLFRTQFGEQT